MNTFFSKTWYLLGEYRQRLPLLAFLVFLSALLETFGIGLLGPFLSIAYEPELVQGNDVFLRVYTTLGFTTYNSFLIFLSCLIAIIFVIKSFLYFISQAYLINFSHSHRAALVEQLNSSYLHGSYESFLGRNSSNLVKNIVHETQCFTYYVLLKALQGFSGVVTSIFLLCLLAVADPTLLIVALTTFLPALLLFYGLKTKLRLWSQSASLALEGVIKTLTSGVGGLKETKVIGCEPYFEHEMNRYLRSYVRGVSLASSTEHLPRIMVETTLVVGIVFFIAVVKLFLDQHSDQLIGSLGVFAIAAIRLLPASNRVTDALNNLQKARHTVDILYADLKSSGDRTVKIFRNGEPKRRAQHRYQDIDSDLKPSISLIKSYLEISNLSYYYPDSSTPALSQINLKIEKGSSIAFIGKSGSGKTTLVDIILALLMPRDGDVKVDGTSIYNNVREWQDQVAYIPQSIFLIDDTIEQNIALGVPAHLIDQEKLSGVIRDAQLNDLIQQLPDGLRTVIGERGIRLSGGQRQRIGIARALYHDREVLILDEATSALDSETERLITESIDSLSGQKTIVIVAHRMSTIQNCDYVYQLEDGKISRIEENREVASL